MRRIALLALALATSCGGGPDLKPIEWQVRRGELAEARAALDAVPADQRDASFTALARRVDAALAELERVRAGIATVEAEREGLELDEVLARLKRLDPASEAAEELVSIARSAAVDWDAERRARSGFQLRPRYEEEEDLEPVVAKGPEEPVDAFVREVLETAELDSLAGRHAAALGALEQAVRDAPAAAGFRTALQEAQERARREARELIEAAEAAERLRGLAGAWELIGPERHRFPSDLLAGDWAAALARWTPPDVAVQDAEVAVAKAPATGESTPSQTAPQDPRPPKTPNPAEPLRPQARPAIRLTPEELVLDAGELAIAGERARVRGDLPRALALLRTAAGRTAGPEHDRYRRRANEVAWLVALEEEWPAEELGAFDPSSSAELQTALEEGFLGDDARAGLVLRLLGTTEVIDPERALDVLAGLPDLDAGHRDLLVARARGTEVPEGGFVLHEGAFLGALDHDRELVGREVERLLRAVLGDRVPQRLEAHATLVELARVHPWAEKELARGLTELEAKARRGLGRSKAWKPLLALAEERAQLDAARKRALALIFDEQRYFYPVPPNRRAEYEQVQREVDERVAAVRELWDAGSTVRLDERFRESLRDLTWARREQGHRSLPEDVPAWMALLGPELEELALDSFAWDHRERARLLRDRWIEARNERVWSGAAETDGVACGRAEQEQVRITNRYRALLGRQSVAWDPLIQAAAAVHSDYMSRTGNFGHFEEDVPGRRTPFDRMREQGYDRGVSENCHAGSGSPEGAHQGWTHSSGHHRNLLMTGHTEMATAVAGPYWTQNFGMGEASRAELPPPPPAPWHD